MVNISTRISFQRTPVFRSKATSYLTVTASVDWTIGLTNLMFIKPYLDRLAIKTERACYIYSCYTSSNLPYNETIKNNSQMNAKELTWFFGHRWALCLLIQIQINVDYTHPRSIECQKWVTRNWHSLEFYGLSLVAIGGAAVKLVFPVFPSHVAQTNCLTVGYFAFL